jgi:hypothetical protein
MTLDTTGHSRYQRRACERAVRDLHGVIGVSNQMVVKPHVAAADMEVRIGLIVTA